MRYTGSGEQNELLKNHLENWSKEGADVRGVHSKLSSLLKDASASFSGTLDKLLKFPVPEYYGRTPNQCEKPKTKGSELKSKAMFFVDEVLVNNGALINLANPMGKIVDYKAVAQALAENGNDIEKIPFVAIPKSALADVRMSAHGYSSVEMRRAKYFVTSMGELPKTIVKEPGIPMLKKKITPRDAAKLIIDRPFVLSNVENMLRRPGLNDGQREVLQAYQHVLSSEKNAKPLHIFSSGLGLETSESDPALDDALDVAFEKQEIDIVTLTAKGLSPSIVKINRQVFDDTSKWYQEHGGEMVTNRKEVEARQVGGGQSLNVYLAENNEHFGNNARSMVGSVIHRKDGAASVLCTGFDIVTHEGRNAVEYKTDLANGQQNGDLKMRYFPTMDMYQAERTLANGEKTVSMAKSSPKEAWMDAEHLISNKQSHPTPNKPQKKQSDDLTIKHNAGFKP
jgi:hypothetical protein